MKTITEKIYDYSIRARDLTSIFIRTPFIIKNHQEYNRFKREGKLDQTCIIELHNGLKIKFRHQDIFIIDELVVRGEYLRYLKTFIKSQDNSSSDKNNQPAVVDIGANIGCFSLQAAWQGAKVYAVEASAINMALLKENIALNNLQDKIIPTQKAIWKENTTLTFHASPKNPGSGSLVYNSVDDSEKVEAISMNEYIGALPEENIKILKMDIEGAEFEVLPTVTSNVYKKIEVIIGEYHQNAEFSAHNYETVRDILKPYFEVKKRGFALFFGIRR